MLTIHRLTDSSAETEAAELLGRLAATAFPELRQSDAIRLDVFPRVQCYGQKTQDIDLLVFFADYRSQEALSKTKNGKLIHSFCATIEVKGHEREDVRFDGANCSVRYRAEWHDVSSQSENQKHSVRKYIERNSKSKRAPWVCNLIWLTRVPRSAIPSIDSNLLCADSTWEEFIEKISLLQGTGNQNNVQSFSSRNYLAEVSSIFSRRIEASKIDRKRLEAITKTVLDRTKQQYAAKLGQQLLVFRGRGGTGKTVRLIRIAYQAYDESGLRVLLLTYNKALVSDLRRLLALLGVKDAIGEGSIAVKTIHSFMYEWLLALGVIRQGQSDFISSYEQYKEEALSLLRGGALHTADYERAKAAYSRSLSWDLVLIDESQDWPANERDILYRLYGPKKIIIADGVDQFVRGVSRIDWRDSLGSNESQVVSLTKSLRLKSTLCETVGHFAELIEFNNWNLEPEPEARGGKVIVVEGNIFSDEFHHRLANSAKADGNKPIDMLLCVPPTWVRTIGDKRESVVARKYKEWGLQVWDGVDSEERSDFPTSLDQFRIVQYESCRGLEGWVVVNFGFDEFFEYKNSNAEFGDGQRQDIFFEEESASLEYAKKWLMIPLTRAIDTLVLHIADRNSYVGKTLGQLKDKYPDEIEWLKIPQ